MLLPGVLLCLITDVDANIMLGYIMITWLSTMIFFNISVITCDLIIFIRLLILRYRVQTRNLMILTKRKLAKMQNKNKV